MIILSDIRLRAAKSQKNDHSKRTVNIKEFVCAAGSVTTSIAHIWLNKADCGLFFLSEFLLVRCLSAIADFSEIHYLSLQLATVEETERSVHSFGNSRLCVLELMTIYI